MTQPTDDLILGTSGLPYHSAPSPFPRRLDPVETAAHFDEHGFKAVVHKSHHHNTVMDVLTIKASVLDTLRVRGVGGIALNGMPVDSIRGQWSWACAWAAGSCDSRLPN